ncbi:macrophage mannose receptor 1-like isoform X2 [Anoplolepis gracilipes]|uniref:macrophage mannose receptor 1-like isoform X2 n=1 Tax=Anoplolepis gracilipes TaxID=354296 RepID=UPI003B9F0D72
MLTIVFFLFYFIVPNLSSNDFTTHIFVDDNVEYIFCGYRVTWDEARVICLSYKAELATVDTDRKVQTAIHAIVDNNLPIYDNLWIGGREESPGVWFWISNGNKMILKSAPYRNVSLWYPNSSNEDLQQCLSIDRLHHDVSILVPLRCNQRRSFICQRDRDQSNGKSTKMVGSIRTDEEEFILYSTRLTWPEAVVHCQKEGLHIAEVKTMSQAQSLAFLMIRTRPESIENAWIGGYATANMWKWLSSGSNISNNDLWRNYNRELHGCLLLDRHMCEIPVYLEAKCDRKRDVLCQRPSRERIDKKPIPVYVEECFYWIGFHPLTWIQAQLSCKELNASLVILNSSRILNHMMSLMEDNKKDLRHIWTDGRRKLSTFNDTTLWRWTWESTGELISEIDASFVPWCLANQCHNNDANCLNLDHADYTPIIYGLNCNQSQMYICQPRSAACLPRRSNLNTSYAVPSNNDLPQTFSFSKTTASYYDKANNQKSVHTTLFISTNHSS